MSFGLLQTQHQLSKLFFYIADVMGIIASVTTKPEGRTEQMSKVVFIGTDGGATTSKVGGVWEDGSTISTKLLQASTNSVQGPEAVVRGWTEAVNAYLSQYSLTWDQVGGVGLAVPGPFQRYGVFDHSANLPDNFTGFDVHTSYSKALAERAGRPIPLTVGNDGDMGGVAEAQHVRGDTKWSVLMLAPGSGLGCAYVDKNGLALDGDTLAGMEGGHMPAPLHLLGAKPYPCGCGRTWGCIEVYTCLSGLPHLLAEKLEKYPDHELAKSTLSMKERAFSLRGRAQKGDPLAVEIFDFQSKALGLHLANMALALDPKYVVIGGGLMDPESTTDVFRERYLNIVRATAREYLWPSQRDFITIVPASLGDLSQAIGAALSALYKSRKPNQ
jgi:glucokinase